MIVHFLMKQKQVILSYQVRIKHILEHFFTPSLFFLAKTQHPLFPDIEEGVLVAL